MKFLHIADVHLGAEPNAGKFCTSNRGKEIWDSFERVIGVCRKEKIDLLLIAGDLFHRQPLLRELKEVNYLFSGIKDTEIVLIAGNHDYIKVDSYYRTFRWNDNVHPLFSEHFEYIELPQIHTCVYGLSYHQREVAEPLYDQAEPQNNQPYEILLAHGGDDRHIPIRKNRLDELGYDYVALGHIHKPAELLRNRIAYAGALEPVDINDTGKHGFIKGEIDASGSRIVFVPFAKREYIHLRVEADKQMTNGELKGKVRQLTGETGAHNMYKIVLEGFRDPDIEFQMEDLAECGNIVETEDLTRPAYDFEKLRENNQNNLLGHYIESLIEYPEGTIEHQALYEGVQALLTTKRG